MQTVGIVPYEILQKQLLQEKLLHEEPFCANGPEQLAIDINVKYLLY